jgi:GNAT superfamily N-acetyltransferase
MSKKRDDFSLQDVTYERLDPAFMHGPHADAYKTAYRDVFGGEPWYEQYRCAQCTANGGSDLQFPLYLKTGNTETCIRALPEDMTCPACGIGKSLVPFWPDERIHKDILHELSLPAACGFVAFYHGEIVGFTLGFCAAPEYLEDHLGLSGLADCLVQHGAFRRIAYLSDMAVVPSFRGNGIARELFAKRELALLAAEPDAQVFRTRPDTKTYGWYQHEFGFTVVDRYSRVSDNDVRVILLYPHPHH